MAAGREGNRDGHVMAGTVLLIGLLFSMPIQAGFLVGLVQDASDGSLKMLEIDVQTGQTTSGSAAIENCCLVGMGLTAVDADSGRVFAFGRRSSGPQAGEPALMTLSLDGKQVFHVEPEQTPQALLAYDNQSARLISATLSSAPEFATRWISLDPVTGQVEQIGAEQSNCCEIVSGLATVGSLPTGSRVMYFIGRLFGVAEWHLLAMDLANGNLTVVAELPAGNPGFLVLDQQTGLLEVMMQTAVADALRLYRVDPDDGMVSLAATHSVSECCLVSPGDVASLDPIDMIWWVGGSGSRLIGPTAGYFALQADTDSNAVPDWSLDADLRLHALMFSFLRLMDLLFQDRFEM